MRLFTVGTAIGVHGYFRHGLTQADALPDLALRLVPIVSQMQLLGKDRKIDGWMLFWDTLTYTGLNTAFGTYHQRKLGSLEATSARQAVVVRRALLEDTFTTMSKRRRLLTSLQCFYATVRDLV